MMRITLELMKRSSCLNEGKVEVKVKAKNGAPVTKNRISNSESPGHTKSEMDVIVEEYEEEEEGKEVVSSVQDGKLDNSIVLRPSTTLPMASNNFVPIHL